MSGPKAGVMSWAARPVDKTDVRAPGFFTVRENDHTFDSAS